MYKGLNRDSVDIRFDIRLDTNFTHKQHKVLSEVGNPELRTYTDFLNNYRSKLQSMSYMFLGSQTTPEVCAGVVKAALIHEKNPAQPAADQAILETFKETRFAMAKGI